MKKITTLLLSGLFLISSSINAQYFVVNNVNATMNPGNLNNDNEYPVGGGLPAGWNTLFTGTTNTANSPSYTSSQTIPFPFQFDGSPVTAYKVSTNGVLTFDVAATANPTATNASLPSTSIPNQSVVIWGLHAGGGGDYIISKTFGSSPNRQHWVQFNSYSTAGAGWSYWSIVLEESSNKIYVVDQRTNTGPLSLTVGIQINSTTAIQTASSPNQNHNTSNGPTPADNSYYEFIPGTQPADDALLESLSIPNPAPITNPIPISGTIKNLGTATLTSVEVNWRIAGSSTINRDTLSVNVATNGTTTFSHSVNWNPPSAGQFYDLEVWTANPNGNLDGNPANDSISAQYFTSTGNSVQKNALFEEFTTTSCGWCPDGHLIMSQITNANPNVIPVSLHSCFGTDVMTSIEASQICSQLGINSAPTGMVDRKLFPGEQNVAFGRGGNAWVIRSNSQSQAGSPVDITMNGTYTPSNRLLNVDVNVSFVDYALPGDIRVSLMLVEDSVSGGTQYNQRNFYSGNPNFTTHPFYSQSDPLINYDHRHVLRDILPSTWGDAAVIPNNYVLNNNYTRNFLQGISTSFDEDQVYLVAVVSYYGGTNDAEYEVLNALEVKMKNLTTGIEQNAQTVNDFKIYPNPTNLPITNVEFNLAERNPVQLRIMDITGKVVAQEDFGQMSNGNQRIQLNTAQLENGFYFVNLKAGAEEITRKISVLR